MALSRHDQVRIREYLLGKLSEDEQQKIEERLLLDDELFEEFEISKGELIEEYRAGELPQDEQKWFESHYLASNEGRRSHTFAVALSSLNRPQPAPPLSWFERMFTVLRTRPAAFATVGAAVVILAVASLMLISPTRPRTSIELTLQNTAITRSTTGGGWPKVPLKRDVGELRIWLALPQPGPPDANYRAELSSERDSKPLKPEAHNTNSVLVVIPATDLAPGRYSLGLYVVKSEGEEPIPGNYLFEITN